MIKRAGSADVLLCPARAAIACKQYRSTVTNNPTTFVADKIDVYKLEPARRALAAPTIAAIFGVNKNAVDYALAFADLTDHPSFLLARKTHAVELYISAFEFLGQEDPVLRPVRAVASDENRVSG